VNCGIFIENYLKKQKRAAARQAAVQLRDDVISVYAHTSGKTNAYRCPKCGEPIERRYSSEAQKAGGLAGFWLYAAFASFHCVNCGKIRRHEFPSEVRAKMATRSFLMVAGGIAVLIVCIWLLSQQ
jgi:predicted RNA-binding Zn-ribbon protein involved in translation (DUF1610 family)